MLYPACVGWYMVRSSRFPAVLWQWMEVLLAELLQLPNRIAQVHYAAKIKKKSVRTSKMSADCTDKSGLLLPDDV